MEPEYAVANSSCCVFARCFKKVLLHLEAAWAFKVKDYSCDPDPFVLPLGNFQEEYGGRIVCTLGMRVTAGPKLRFSALIYAFSEAEPAAVLCHQWPHFDLL